MIPAHRLDGPEDAPVLVLPCSLGTTRELWEPQLDAFAGAFRLLRTEHRGHGESSAPRGPYTIAELGRDLVELLDALGLERVSLCGVSLGGMVGMWLAAEAPERLRSLVLACTAARMPAPEVYRERAQLVREQGLEPVADAVVTRWFTPATARARPELAARYRAILVATSRLGYAGCCEAVADWDFGGRLREVRVPTLVLAGAEDEATPAAATDLLAERIPGARLVAIADAAHLANVERPREFAAAALAHLAAGGTP